MASTKAFLEYVLERLSPLGDVTYRPMMGEYVVYFRGVVVGGIYDDRFLVKPTKAALEVMSEGGASPAADIPYPGAKPMLTADIDDSELTCRLVRAAWDDLSRRRQIGHLIHTENGKWKQATGFCGATGS